MPSFKVVVEAVGLGIDALGVAAIVLGLLVAVVRFAAPRRWGTDRSYRAFRQDIGRGILLGLEFLVAADIIRTVAVSPTVESVLVLGLIVLTCNRFLSPVRARVHSADTAEETFYDAWQTTHTRTDSHQAA